jgi:hypothetical protein
MMVKVEKGLLVGLAMHYRTYVCKNAASSVRSREIPIDNNSGLSQQNFPYTNGKESTLLLLCRGTPDYKSQVRGPAKESLGI